MSSASLETQHYLSFTIDFCNTYASFTVDDNDGILQITTYV